MRFSEDTLEQVRQAVDLADLIGAHVSLRKVGQTWKGLCPFHSEKTPSFTVNPDRQAYHCFGCGAGGDAIRFVMETEKLPFVETGLPDNGDLTARDALVELGWSLVEAERALAEVDPELSIEEQVRHVLRKQAA